MTTKFLLGPCGSQLLVVMAHAYSQTHKYLAIVHSLHRAKVKLVLNDGAKQAFQ